MKAESVKSKPIKIGELVSAFVLDLTTARRQKERGKKNEEKIISYFIYGLFYFCFCP